MNTITVKKENKINDDDSENYNNLLSTNNVCRACLSNSNLMNLFDDEFTSQFTECTALSVGTELYHLSNIKSYNCVFIRSIVKMDYPLLFAQPAGITSSTLICSKSFVCVQTPLSGIAHCE